MNSPTVILAYHRVCPKKSTSAVLRDTIVEPGAFEEHMHFLSKNFRVLSLADLLKVIQTGNNPKDNMAAITFDDNYHDNLVYALPVLKKYSFPATIFVSTAFINTGRAFWWDHLAYLLSQTNTGPAARQKAFIQASGRLKKCGFKEQDEVLSELSRSLGVKEMGTMPRLLNWKEIKAALEGNITFGSHGHTHRIFSGLDNPQALEELKLSRELLESNLGIEVTGIAFPHGEEGDFERKLMPELLQRTGYQYGLTMIQGPCMKKDSIYCLRRIGIGDTDTGLKFFLKLRGIMPYLSKIKKRLYGSIDNNKN